MLLTINWRNEIKKRIANVDILKENVKDANAELEEVLKRDTLSKTRASAENKARNSGGNKTHPAILLDRREEALKIQIIEYTAIINDTKKGWKALNDDQRAVLDLRFKKDYTQDKTAKVLKYDVRTIRRIESEALGIMEKHMTKL